MFRAAEASNKMLAWILRLAGFLVMFMGLGMILKPLSVLADVVPFIGSLVGAGTGIIAFLVAGIFSSLTIAVAWIVYRPLIGIFVLAVSVALIALTLMRMRKGKARAAAGAAAG